MALLELRMLSWPECQTLPTTAVGLIPTGSLEQHGPHLPLITDTALADALAASIARRVVQPVVVAPTFPSGMSDHHLAFPGTVSLSAELFAEIIAAYLATMVRMGLRRVAIMSAHGGNFKQIGRIAEQYARQQDDNVSVAAYSNIDTFTDAMFAGGREAGLDPTPTDLHAGVLETSLALYLFDSTQVKDFAHVAGYVASDRSVLGELATRGIEAFSEVGVLGSPPGATADAGEIIFRYLSDELTRWLVETFDLDEDI